MRRPTAHPESRARTRGGRPLAHAQGMDRAAAKDASGQDALADGMVRQRADPRRPARAGATLIRAFEALDAREMSAGGSSARPASSRRTISTSLSSGISTAGSRCSSARWRPGMGFRSDTERLRLHAAFTIAAMLRQPGHPRLPSASAGGTGRLSHQMPPTARADTATQLLEYFCFTGDLRGARALVREVAPLFDRASCRRFAEPAGSYSSATTRRSSGEYDEGSRGSGPAADHRAGLRHDVVPVF